MNEEWRDVKGYEGIYQVSNLDNPNNLFQVRHKDGNRKNNIINNLEWYGRIHKGDKRKVIKGENYSKKPWYGTYRGMMDRCENPNSANYQLYGGRGIKVCDEWHDIKEFEKWVESSDFKKGLSIDRIDVGGNYEPNNCRWATTKEQANNRRETIKITVNGSTKTISEWSEITGLSTTTIRKRYHKGLSGEEILRGGYNIADSN